MIVLGTHGRTGLGRLLMGSVAEQVVRPGVGQAPEEREHFARCDPHPCKL